VWILNGPHKTAHDEPVEGVRERLEFEDLASKHHKLPTAQAPHVAPSRRRKGIYLDYLEYMNHLRPHLQDLFFYPRNTMSFLPHLHLWYPISFLVMTHPHLLTLDPGKSLNTRNRLGLLRTIRNVSQLFTRGFATPSLGPNVRFGNWPSTGTSRCSEVHSGRGQPMPHW
jgi:hypothetical protein